MKINKLFILFLLLNLMSCEENDNSKLVDWRGSLAKWNELKNKNGNSYVYQTTFVSWSGFGHITKLEIADGVVSSRTYQEFKTDGTNGQREVTDSYSETSVELGSHEKGANTLTIDELYNSCAREYLVVDEGNNTLYFESGADGLMTLCGFVPKGCGDDCFSGISINSFEWIN